MGALDRWLRLTAQQRRLTVASAAAVAATAAALPIVSTHRVLRLAAVPLGQPSGETNVSEWVDAMDRAARYVPGATCLAQSVALAWLLRRCGVDVVVKIGARTETPFSAHAWIESNGVPLTSTRDGERPFTTVLSSEKLRAGN